MPNGRRRRFSVQHNVIHVNANKVQNGSRPGQADPEPTTQTQSPSATSKSNKGKNKTISNSSKFVPVNAVPVLDAVVECDSTSSVIPIRCYSSVDKDVTASSSNIDLFNILSDKPSEIINQLEDIEKRDPRQLNRHEKYPHQHRVKVRSPKRRNLLADNYKTEPERATIGLNAIDWEQEMEECIEDHDTVTPIDNAVVERVSNHSLDDMCRICHGGEALSPELGQMISACACRGTVGRVHVKCLERWLTESGKSRCELCGTRYATRRVHRYGLPKAFVMWILSQNAKQLMVDTLGIMLMSPLAVLAAWLSGRTLAGLMTPESHVTPWPLASTFVLACMTLVCYYCWIVSAATRHALGWWIWYRSQYEVRLQIQENEE